ncbi:hypothetical protein [Nocardioides sp. R-C-SC26]|uniref:hypothetical protein n=1 Tax=Nocardioides sp. R-C-SC26 TaxID=2870414 RepID=UPI001E2D6C90|nr:hypothetical protein [Nocardioides sp. R-C-SC26]
MSEDTPQSMPPGRPVIAGLVALVGVAVVVGAIVGVAALIGTRALGIGDAESDGGATAQATLFVPAPTDTFAGTDPYITLSGTPTPVIPEQPEPTEETTEDAEPTITLQAGQSAVGPMERIDLSGVYADGEGAVLQVQQFSGGEWTDFPVTASVSGGSFGTYIQAGAIGLNRFRVYDTEKELASNEVEVRIG